MNTTATSALPDRKAILAADPGIGNAARWFWWIAGLSAVNSVLIHSGSETSFLAGLGFTLVADAIFQSLKPVAFTIDALAVGFFVTMGVVALRGYRWAFLIGGILYALDGLIYLYFQDWLPFVFHLWALYCIGKGGMALHRAIKQQDAPPPLPAAAQADDAAG